MQTGNFIGCTLVASGIKGAMIIFHGICGCNIEAIHLRSDQIPGGTYTPIIPTGLNEFDCINGGIEKLLKTLRDSINQSLKKQKPPSIVFVLTGDAQAIVGDDIKTAAKVVEQETGIKIIAIDSAGFSGGVSQGTNITLTLLTDKLSNKISKPKKQSGLNIVAPHLIGSKNWNNDIDEIIRLLEESNIKVNLNLCRNFEINNINNFSKSKFNYILSGEQLDSFEEISKTFNVETFQKNIPLPIGIANTEEWLLTMARDLGNIDKAKQILKKEQVLITSQLKYNYNFSWLSTLMHGKYAAIYGNAKFTASLARCLLWDFGIIPKVTALIAETDKAMNEAIDLLEPIAKTVELSILKNPDYFKYGNTIKECKVDFAIGSIQDKPLCMGHKIPHLSLSGFNFFNQYNFIPWPYFGIKGTLGLLTELAKVMEDAFYLKDMISEYNYNPKD